MTGIRPAVAQTLVELGVELTSIRTLRNLQEGLRDCLRDMELRKGGATAMDAR
jgi:rsbT co-antagonist protein RsbR